MIEELREKHKTVLRLIIAGTGSEIINELLEGHTAITLQAVVDVLEDLRHELFTKGQSCPEITAPV